MEPKGWEIEALKDINTGYLVIGENHERFNVPMLRGLIAALLDSPEELLDVLRDMLKDIEEEGVKA